MQIIIKHLTNLFNFSVPTPVDASKIYDALDFRLEELVRSNDAAIMSTFSKLQESEIQ